MIKTRHINQEGTRKTKFDLSVLVAAMTYESKAGPNDDSEHCKPNIHKTKVSPLAIKKCRILVDNSQHQSNNRYNRVRKSVKEEE